MMAKTARQAVAAAAILAMLSLPLLAQSAASAPFPPLAGVAVSGSARFSPGLLVAATGLHRGQPMSLHAMNQGVQRLVSSGDFSRVTYRYTYSSLGTNVEFQVTDQSHLLPVVFDNFVWMPRLQLMRLLRSQIPLFCGEVPLSGKVNLQITAALQAILRRRGVKNATVQGMPFQAHLGSGSFDSYMFSVQGVQIPVQRVAFPGAPPNLLPLLRKKAAGLIGQAFSLDFLAAVVQTTFLPVLQDRGFLQAKFGPPAVVPSDPAISAVSVSFNVDPGPPYRWGAVGFQGNAVFDAKKLRKLAPLRRGDLADQATLAQVAAAIRSLYRNAGYLQAAVTSHFSFPQPGLAATTIVVHEGPQFRMGAVNFEGVAGQAAAQLRRLWQLAPGQPYRAGYLHQYMASIFRRFNFAGDTISSRVRSDAQSHVVDVTIVLSRPAAGGGPSQN